MALDDSVLNMQLEAFRLPKIDVYHKDTRDYADNGGRASSLPIEKSLMYQLVWKREGQSISMETYFLDHDLHAILREEKHPDTRFTKREVHAYIPSPEDAEGVAEAVHQLASMLYEIYFKEYGSELPLKRQETEGLVGTYLLCPRSFRESFSHRN